jgi:hypothetical protein
MILHMFLNHTVSAYHFPFFTYLFFNYSFPKNLGGGEGCLIWS